VILNKVLVTVLIAGLVISLAANAVLADARKDAQEARQTAIDREGFDWNSFLPILALPEHLADAAESADNKEIALRAGSTSRLKTGEKLRRRNEDAC